MNKLFRITLASSFWYRGNKPKPLYVAAKDKEAAKLYVERYLAKELSVKSISYLGDERSSVMFSAN